MKCLAVMLLLSQLMSLNGAQRASLWTALALRSGMLLRLHVVAASDDTEDQRVKLCVRDAVREAYAAQEQDGVPMAEQAEKCLPQLQQAAEETARAEGFDGPVTVTMEQCAFDARTLDGLTIPAGVYPALMVRLGAAEGHNWWGLMDRELALAAAETDAEGTLIFQRGNVRWMLVLPGWLLRLMTGEDAA